MTEWDSEMGKFVAYHRAKGTSISYRRVASTYLTQLGERYEPGSFRDMTRDQIMAWIGELRDRGLSESSLRSISGLVRTFYRWLYDGELPQAVKGISVGRARSRIQTKGDLLTEGEFNRLVNASRPRDRVVFLLLRWTGARPSEVLGLTGKDVTLQPQGDFELSFRDTKNGETRIVPLVNPEAIVALKDYLEIAPPGRDNVLFPGRKGRPLQAASLWRVMRRTADRVDIDRRVYPYMLRHQVATEAYRYPQGIRDKLLGWKSGAMAKNYEHLDTEDVASFLREQQGGSHAERLVESIRESMAEILENPEMRTLAAGLIKEMYTGEDDVTETVMDALDDSLRGLDVDRVIEAGKKVERMKRSGGDRD